jgi:hypothetical protein
MLCTFVATKVGLICKLQKCTTHVHSSNNEIHTVKLMHVYTLANPHVFTLVSKCIGTNSMTCNTIFIILNVGNSNMHDTMKVLKTLVSVSKANMPPNHLIGMDSQDEVIGF